MRYIREYCNVLCTSLQLSDKLNSYLVDVDEQAQAQGITEALKAANPMAWVGRMNNI